MSRKIRMIELMLERRVFGVMAVALATLLFQSTSALAGMVTGSIAVDFGNATTSPLNGNINTITVFNLPTIITGGAGTGDFDKVVFDETLGSATLNTTSPSTFSFGSTAFGTFTGLSIISQVTGQLTQAYQILGTFTPGTDEPNTTANSASFTISFTQNGGPSAGISASGTLNTPAPVPVVSSVPEPASVVLGLSAVVAGGLFHVVRRRKPTV